MILRINKKHFLALLIAVIFFYAGNSQEIDSLINNKDSSIVYEKVCLHIDREYYAPGDTIWFKSYLVSGISNKLEVGFKNVFVQLISPTGKVISNRLLMSVYGTSHGDFALGDSLPAGQYTIRAKTKYQENFNEKSYFHRKIWIARSGYFVTQDSTQNQKTELGEILFFPEGGNLIENTANHVAFKSIDKYGKGITVSGRILNHDNKTIATFKTDFQGMGKFIFMPKEGKEYHVKIDGYPKFNCKIPEIRDDGIAMHCEDETAHILISLARNYKNSGHQTFYLVARHKGLFLFQKTIKLDNFEQGLRISKSLFPLGISKISLLDDKADIVAERLVFISDGQLSSVKINTHKAEYTTREKVELSVEPFLTADDSVTSTLSVAVVDESYFSCGGNTQTIQSYLLLDSELKGAIESPARYFVDEDSITSSQKLDLLMMVQGWRSYYWDEIIENGPNELKNWNDAGITISGTMKRIFRSDKVADGKVKLSSFTPLIVESTKTDSFGHFSFKRLFLKDSAEVILLGENRKGRKNVEIIPDLQAQIDSLVSPDSINRVLTEIGIPMKYVRENYLNQLAWQQFDPEKGSIVLEDIEVKARKIDNPQQVLFYKPSMYLADDSYSISKDDYKYGNVHDFLLNKAELPVGVWRTNKFGAPYSVVQYFLDGEYILGKDIYDDTENVLGLPIKDIYQIDVEKKFKVNLVYVYTKKLDLRESSGGSTRGKSIVRVDGFQQPNKFYSPKYTPENIDRIATDYRPTLHWSPNVVVDNGEANLEFFTCDELSNYIVIVEGISENGKICFGATTFKVVKSVE